MLFGLMNRLLAGHKGAVAAIVVLQLMQTAGTLLLPTINAAIIDDGIVAGNPQEIFGLGTILALLAAVQAAAVFGASNDRPARASARAQYSSGMLQPLMILIPHPAGHAEASQGKNKLCDSPPFVHGPGR